ncbi:MAG: DUF2214 family protein [Longimicrobiales bacterium]
MTLRWVVASLHLIALGIGLGAVWVRARALRAQPDADRLKTAFRADALWGIAALIWISTGLWRAFGGLEKGTDYYLGSQAFRIKMTLLIVVLLLEVMPMLGLMRWRKRSARGEPVDLSRAPLFSGISLIQAVLVVLMVFAAAAMARGLGA